MAELSEMVQYLAEQGVFTNLVNNPMAQFGPPEQNLLGAELLPERLVPENSFTEEAIQFRTVIANSATRYSPVQKKGTVLTGSMRVSLGEQDIGSEYPAKDYDALIRLARQSIGTGGVMGNGYTPPSMTAETMITRWVDITVNRALRMLNERERWQAIVNAQVIRTGDDGYSETVNYPNPSGQRVTAGGTWSSNSYDPYADIIAGAEFLAAKGFTVNRIITGTDVRTKLSNNAKMTARVGKINVQTAGLTNQPAGRATLTDLNETFGTDGLPSISLYDLQYRTQTSSGFYLPRGTMVLLATTGRDESIDRADVEPLLLSNTLGYTAIGRAQGQSNPGRVVKVKVQDEDKPYSVKASGWQTTLPVITEAEGVYVISGIA